MVNIMTRIDSNPNEFPDPVFQEFPKCMRKKRADGQWEFRDALNVVEEHTAIGQGWEPNGTHDERAFDKATHDQALPDDYEPIEYPKYIAELGRDVHSREEEERLLGSKPVNAPETKKVSVEQKIIDQKSIFKK